MARKNNLKRKFHNANRSKFKRILKNERNRINDRIPQLSNQTRVSEVRSQPENDNETAEQSSDYHHRLRDWALQYNIRTYCLRDLLKILRDIGVPFIPKDPATFLQTPKIVETERIADGEFWYSGVTNKLRRILQSADVNMQLELNFHVDGLQLFNSSSKQFWPILGQVHG